MQKRDDDWWTTDGLIEREKERESEEWAKPAGRQWVEEKGKTCQLSGDISIYCLYLFDSIFNYMIIIAFLLIRERIGANPFVCVCEMQNWLLISLLNFFPVLINSNRIYYGEISFAKSKLNSPNYKGRIVTIGPAEQKMESDKHSIASNGSTSA